MTPLDQLLELLRRIAEKMPEKMWVFIDEAEPTRTEYIRIPALKGTGDIGKCIELKRLDNPEFFSCDHIDAIASAVGYDFEARLEDEWWFAIMDKVEGQWVDEGGMFATKREASIAALVSILTHVLERKQ